MRMVSWAFGAIASRSVWAPWVTHSDVCARAEPRMHLTNYKCGGVFFSQTEGLRRYNYVKYDNGRELGNSAVVKDDGCDLAKGRVSIFIDLKYVFMSFQNKI